ncbi:Sec-independent protein translocase protein TatB [Actibacterium ureilyticum]|uniref:Sec-independent protein translocase protein TatB n=1 Tax=Actibacterium ureilyticum TaxID=1590614 RepID=UPI000BAB212C|nr:Sec-independent protein translocase protein TatB [Actibacterium ureilyticum]
MFDLGWTELLVIGIVALIVIGPKDLPGMFHALGKFTSKLRRMAREFQNAMEDAAKESGMKDAASDLRDLTNPRKMGLDAVKDAADKFDRWEPGARSDKPKGDTAKADTAEKGPATEKLSEERAEAARKIRDAAAEKARARQAAEAEAATAEADATAAKPAASGSSDA